ncbi:cation efflux protein [Endogone sp. FLAS-F59071]|nr:cation efflux protein [Endogone sp. FLAS-F59071]|eukprot:RUS20490.1 cation efflux protein [Endogone sp. FLAS-F59071]
MTTISMEKKSIHTMTMPDMPIRTSSCRCKRGTRITLIGLGANVCLTVTKGIAGWIMNSASLVADAAHSLSDLISDFVTLYTFQMSRKPPDSNHPYGYGKYETVGSLAVSSLLVTVAIGIGWHSYELLLGILTPEIPAATDAVAAAPTAEVTAAAALNPNAAWFALASVVVKEWLYRATMKVGIDEKSNVLVANAWHHRSDAFSSIVALGAIGGSYIGFPILDPLGGILVAGMIMKSGVEIMLGSLKELVDVGLEGDVIKQVEVAIAKVKVRSGCMEQDLWSRVLESSNASSPPFPRLSYPCFDNTETNIIDFHSIRGRKAGPFFLVDLILQVNPELTVSKAHRVEEVVRRAVKQECQQVKEVMIHLDAEKEPPHP